MQGTVHLFIEKMNRLCQNYNIALKALHTLFINDIRIVLYFLLFPLRR
jgi:hypothetical protein